MEVSTKGERFKELFDFLKSKALIHNQKELADCIGKDKSNISKALKGIMTESLLSDINSKFNNMFNIDYILHGSGQLLVSNNDIFSTSTFEEYEKAIKSGLKMIPEHESPFRGGNSGELLSKDDIVSYWHVPGAKGRDIITITGDSMAPVYPAGTKVLLREFGFTPEHPTSIPFGNPFAIEIEDPITNQRIGYVKYLRRHSDPKLSSKYWVAHSADKLHFDDFDIPIEQVRGLWIVEFAIRHVF
ncbi:hypothetical protein [Porphyromonas pogonae]|uniref:S24 family peptidase n=1 Tax=Porphyromonas pogonae TaxID=867595 RepID=UPI002E774D0F|nr:hypothetical protein [Porphyromonas pogonae]